MTTHPTTGKFPTDQDVAALLGFDPFTPGQSAEGDEITTAQLGDLLDLGERAVQQLTRGGVLKQIGKGRYSRRDAVRAYSRDLRKKATGRGLDADFMAARTRTAEAQAAKIERQNAAAAGEYVATGQVEREWSNILRDVRAAMLAVPSRVGSRVPTLTPHDISMIYREIADALGALADGEPAQASGEGLDG